MMILISGSNGSGKSCYAEQLVEKTTGPRYYIATMVAENEENDRRIKKHRRQRAGLGFTTIEEPYHVGDAAVSLDSVVLLEDTSNLLANLVFAANGTAEQALGEILQLKRKCKHLLVVTISDLSAEGYDGKTAEYIHGLNWLNGRLLEEADAAVALENGEAMVQKGNFDELF